MLTRNLIFLLALPALLAWPGVARTQIQIGTVKGTITDARAAVLPGAEVTLENLLSGYRATTNTDTQGRFTFNNVPFAAYRLRVAATGFTVEQRELAVRSNLPLAVEVSLQAASLAASTQIAARDELARGEVTSTQVELDASFVQTVPRVMRTRQLQKLVATAPGVTSDNNGLLHVRGVDDGVLYVIDGVPTADRVDLISAGAPDAETMQAVEIITGGIAAEFGGRAGAVVTVQTKSGMDAPLSGNVTAGAGGFRSNELDFGVGGGRRDQYGLFLSGAANRSNRWLDPVDPRNFNNRGGALRLNLRADWHPTARDIVLFHSAAGGSDFRVTNDLEQELRGQRQRQELRDNSQSLSWQRVWSATSVSNVSYFRRAYQSDLFGSEFDVPIFAAQDRGHTRQGVIANFTQLAGGHTIKAGVEASRVAIREFFTFAITDEELAEAREVSEAAEAFDRANPFLFRDHQTRGLASAYVQDSFALARRLTVNAGLRFDYSNLLVADHQWSPRLGAVYHITRTSTSLRASFNRLYQPPQVENLLLANSAEARALSPFPAENESEAARVRPAKVSAYEVGLTQDVRGWMRLDAAVWHRDFRNFDDPNVFFNTTIIFPNSVARGWARGVDVRMDVPERRGWSGYLSYTNQRIQQTGPINGGLFLTDEFIEIGPGTRFIPDHDQRNVGSFAVTYRSRWPKSLGLWASFFGRHESGSPLEVDADELDELRDQPGAELVNFDRGRMKPRTTFDLSTGLDLLRRDHVTATAQLDIENLFNRRFAYSFGNPFEGTRFGPPRLWSARLKLTFR